MRFVRVPCIRKGGYYKEAKKGCSPQNCQDLPIKQAQIEHKKQKKNKYHFTPISGQASALSVGKALIGL
jgi:hypothetical protein